MTTIEDKISLFSKIIYDKVNEEKQGRLATFATESEKRINAEKQKIDELRQSLQKDVSKKSNIKANGIVAKERLKKQREILILKEKLINETLENVRQKLIEFVSLAEYKPYFISILEKTLVEIEAGDYYLIVLKGDYEKFKNEIEVMRSNNINNRNVEIKISEGDFIGGIVLKDIEGKFKIDNSLSSKLEECKEIIGVRVMEMLA